MKIGPIDESSIFIEECQQVGVIELKNITLETLIKLLILARIISCC